MKTKLTSKAQITIPKAIRQQMNLKEGDFISFEQEKPGTWVFSKVTPKNQAYGVADQFCNVRHVKVEDMNVAIRKLPMPETSSGLCSVSRSSSKP